MTVSGITFLDEYQAMLQALQIRARGYFLPPAINPNEDSLSFLEGGQYVYKPDGTLDLQQTTVQSFNMSQDRIVVDLDGNVFLNSNLYSASNVSGSNYVRTIYDWRNDRLIASGFQGNGSLLTGIIGSSVGGLTANRALISSGTGNVAVSSTVTSTELGYLDGVTSAIQTQLNNRLQLTGGNITGNLGIGTATPICPLDVNGDLRASRIGINIPGIPERALEVGGTAVVYGGEFYLGDPVTLEYVNLFYYSGDPNGDAGFYDWSAARPILSYFKSPLQVNLLQNGGGNVGIGTTRALDQLHVQGNMRCTGTASFSQDVTIANPGDLSFGSTSRQMLNLFGTSYALGVQSSTMYYRSGGNYGWFLGGSHSGTALDPGTGGSVLMALRNTGFLGIGTTNPQHRLTVFDNTNSASYQIGARQGLLNNNAAGIYAFHTSNQNVFGFQQLYTGDGLIINNQNNQDISYQITGSGNSHNFLVGATTRASISGGGLQVTGSVGIGTAPRQELDIIGDCILSGFLGVGTTNPATRLHVVGNTITQGTAHIISALDTTGYLLNLGDTGGGSFRSAYIYGDGNSNMFINNQSQGYLRIYTGNVNTKGIHIEAIGNGNIGVGNVAPSCKLHVTGSVRSTVQYQANASDTAAAPGYSWDTNLDTGMFHPATDVIAFSTEGTEKVRILANGNVGIGTQTVRQKLDVQGNAIVSGNIGIGTTIPTKKLDVNGTVRLNTRLDISGTADYPVDDTIIAQVMMGDYPCGIRAVVPSGLAATRQRLDLCTINTGVDITNPLVRMSIISNSGNVGIGTDNPEQKFVVNGTAKATDIQTGTVTTTDLNASGHVEWGYWAFNTMPAWSSFSETTFRTRKYYGFTSAAGSRIVTITYTDLWNGLDNFGGVLRIIMKSISTSNIMGIAEFAVLKVNATNTNYYLKYEHRVNSSYWSWANSGNNLNITIDGTFTCVWCYFEGAG